MYRVQFYNKNGFSLGTGELWDLAGAASQVRYWAMQGVVDKLVQWSDGTFFVWFNDGSCVEIG